jgi:hypothetical protein
MSLAKRSEKGLLTPDNCVVALIDHQPQMLFGITASIVKPLREFTGSGLAIIHGAHGVGLAIYPKQPDADALHPAQVPLN